MSHRALRVLALSFLTAAGSMAVGVRPAFACHLATGWCCVESGSTYYCCYFSNDQIVEESCG